MSSNPRKPRLASLAVLVAGLTACAGAKDHRPVLESIDVGDAQAYGAVGVPQQLTVTGHYSDGTTAVLSHRITWASTDEAVATVDASGIVTPWTPGTARITATDDASGLSAHADLTARIVVPLRARASLPAAGAVDTTATVFRVTGLSPGAMYTPTVSGMTDDVDLVVYSGASLAPEAHLCGSVAVGTAAESCNAPASASGELWIVVDGQWTRAGATFSLDVPRAEAAEIAGTLTYPEQLPYSGSIGVTKRFYQVAGLKPGATYEVRISGLTADIDVAVYPDRYEYAPLCESYQSGTVDDFCTAAAGPTGELFVQIDGETTRDGGSYTLGLTAK